LLKGSWSVSESHLRQVLDIDLDSSSGDSHGVALRLLARPRAALLDHARSLQHTVDSVDTDADTFLAEVVGQAAGTVAGLAAQGHDALHRRLGNGSRMVVRSARVVLETMEVSTCLLITTILLVEGLAADAMVLADLRHWRTSLVHLDPRQPLLNDIPSASLQSGDTSLEDVLLEPGTSYMRVSPMFHNTTAESRTYVDNNH
jgi:hypothetical protein